VRKEHNVAGAEHATFPSHDADLTKGAPTSLDGWLFLPQGTGPFPAVVALHGCAGLYDTKTGDLAHKHRDWAERLQKAGYVVLLPDSYSARGAEEMCSHNERAVRAGYERTRDAYGALEHLQGMAYVKKDKIGLMGWSNGSIAALAAVGAELHGRPKKLANDFKLVVAFYPGCKNTIERANWMPPIAPIHILIGESDDWTPAEACKTLAEQAKSAGVDVTVYPGAYHDFDDPNMTVHVRKNVSTTPSGTATIGTNPAARADAIEKTMKWFADALEK
jgi:dienelactone hydrolase